MPIRFNEVSNLSAKRGTAPICGTWLGLRTFFGVWLVSLVGRLGCLGTSIFTALKNRHLLYNWSKSSSPVTFLVLPLIRVLPKSLASKEAAIQSYLAV